MLDNLLNTNTFAFDVANSAITDGAQPPAAAQAPTPDQADGPVLAVPTPISGEFRVNTTTSDDQTNSSVAALDAGGFVVIWTSLGTDGDGSGLYGQSYTAAGVAEGIEFRVNTTTASDQAFASVASLDGGGFVVTWTSLFQDGSDYGIYGQRYAASGAAVGGEFRVNTVTSDSQLNSSVASLSDGGFVVVWESFNQDGDRAGVYGQRYGAAGATAGGEFRVNTVTTNDQQYASVAGLDGGGFIVTWTSNAQDGQDGMDYGIYGQRYDAAGAAVGSEFLVNSYTTSSQYASSVAALNGGGFVITWTSAGQDANDWGIYGQRYTAAGVAVGGEFRVNSTTNGDQFYSSVTTLADGGFAVTWTSFGQDGDASGVYGQRYTAAGVADGGEFRLNQTTSGFQQQDEVPRQGVAQLAGGQLVAVWTGNGAGDAQGVYARQFSLGATNAAPAGTDATLTITEDTARVLTVADFGFTDTDGDALDYVIITTLPGTGVITLGGWGPVSAGDAVYFDDIAQGLLVYTPGSNGNGTGYASFTFQVRDNSGLDDTDLSPNTLTFNVTAANDAPTIANLQGDVSSQTEGVFTTTFADLGRNAVITDVDSANFAGGRLTVAITSGFQGDAIGVFGDGILAVGAGNVVTISGTAIGVVSGGGYATPRNATLVIDLNSAATIALVQTLLRGIFVADQRIEPGGGTRVIQVTLTDGSGGSSSYTLQLNVTAINDAPSGADRTITMLEDSVLALSNFGFTDVDRDGFAGVTITTLPTAGQLRLVGSPVAAGAFVSAALIAQGELRYLAATNASGTGYASFTFNVRDTGGTANGGVDTDVTANTITIDVTAVNDVPAGTDGEVVLNEDAAHVVTIADFGLSDVDGNTLQAVIITLLPFLGTLTLNGAAVTAGQTVSAANIAAGQLVFTPPSNANGNNYASFSFRVQDNGGTANGGQNTDQTANVLVFDVRAVNDAPVADLNGAVAGIDTASGYTEGSAAIRPLLDLTLSDVDSGTLTGAVVSIGTGFVAGDVLRLAGGQNGTTAGGITFSYNSGTGVLTLSGSASVAAYQAELAALSFKSGNDNPGTARDITVAINDGAASSVAAHIMLTVSPTNDAPVNAVPGAQMAAADSPLVFSSMTGNALSVSDPDAGSGLLRVKLAVTNGTVTLGDSSGVTATGDGTRVVVITGTAAAINAALDGLIYQSNPGYVGPATLKLTTVDLGNTGTGGALTDVDTVTITVQPQIASQEPGLGGAFDVTGLAPKTAGAAAVFDFVGLAGLAHHSGGVVATSLDLAGQIEPAIWHDPMHGGSDFLL